MNVTKHNNKADMGIFDIFKTQTKPYKDPSTNLVYELLFGDNPDLYRNNNQQADIYPWDILYAETANKADLEKIIADIITPSRVKILAYNKLTNNGQASNKKELLGVILEIGLDGGLDVLASFRDGTARYINQTGKMIIWETSDTASNELTNRLFNDSLAIVNQIGPWDKPRLLPPKKNMVRITFLVSDGLYFGEGPIDVLFADPMAGPALSSAAELMKYLIEKASADQ
ncbi:hypothetical protein EWM62_01540 [Mucilaginibacter terrigena]|uniref:Uncharacterized protein n=1 Tax=Mucilaginibacter terrigena TaxID=2492395 RepID=A0A4V1ZCC2_9SPHI|nr:hypothetical protein [Mucilaginibacter terrigena]RYU92150.1 hypothetical protein EWM62_01540 [Mucilaginibacter terrigena]